MEIERCSDLAACGPGDASAYWVHEADDAFGSYSFSEQGLLEIGRRALRG
jgi:hypothetical protein